MLVSDWPRLIKLSFAELLPRRTFAGMTVRGRTTLAQRDIERVRGLDIMDARAIEAEPRIAARNGGLLSILSKTTQDTE